MKKIILFMLLTLVFVSCTNPDEAKRVLEASGFTHIQITGYSIGGCGEADFYHTGFIAIGHNDRHWAQWTSGGRRGMFWTSQGKYHKILKSLGSMVIERSLQSANFFLIDRNRLTIHIFNNRGILCSVLSNLASVV